MVLLGLTNYLDKDRTVIDFEVLLKRLDDSRVRLVTVELVTMMDIASHPIVDSYGDMHVDRRHNFQLLPAIRNQRRFDVSTLFCNRKKWIEADCLF